MCKIAIMIIRTFECINWKGIRQLKQKLADLRAQLDQGWDKGNWHVLSYYSLKNRLKSFNTVFIVIYPMIMIYMNLWSIYPLWGSVKFIYMLYVPLKIPRWRHDWSNLSISHQHWEGTASPSAIIVILGANLSCLSYKWPGYHTMHQTVRLERNITLPPDIVISSTGLSGVGILVISVPQSGYFKSLQAGAPTVLVLYYASWCNFIIITLNVVCQYVTRTHKMRTKWEASITEIFIAVWTFQW